MLLLGIGRPLKGLSFLPCACLLLNGRRIWVGEAWTALLSAWRRYRKGCLGDELSEFCVPQCFWCLCSLYSWLRSNVTEKGCWQKERTVLKWLPGEVMKWDVLLIIDFWKTPGMWVSLFRKWTSSAHLPPLFCPSPSWSYYKNADESSTACPCWDLSASVKEIWLRIIPYWNDRAQLGTRQQLNRSSFKLSLVKSVPEQCWHEL